MAVSERRGRAPENISITNSSATSGSMPYAVAQGGVIMLDSTSTSSDIALNFYVKDSPTGSAYLLVDSAGSPVSRTIGPNESCEVPTECFGAGTVVVVATTAVTASGKFTLKG